jgi:hypothetical protein
VRTLRRSFVDAVFLGAALRNTAGVEPAQPPGATGDAELAGLWRSADAQVRLDLAADGGYRLEVAGRRRTGSGYYRVDGRALWLVDRSGLRTAGSVGTGMVELAGHELFRAGPVGDMLSR